MPCTPSAPSTQSSMPLLLLGPLPSRILNILAYYRWSLALPSTLWKGISSVASSSPRHRVWTNGGYSSFAHPWTQIRFDYRTDGRIRAKPVCLWHLSALFQPRILLPCLWEIIAQRYLITWHWAWRVSLLFFLSSYRLKILSWIVLISILQDIYFLRKNRYIRRMKMIFLKH